MSFICLSEHSLALLVELHNFFSVQDWPIVWSVHLTIAVGQVRVNRCWSSWIRDHDRTWDRRSRCQLRSVPLHRIVADIHTFLDVGLDPNFETLGRQIHNHVLRDAIEIKLRIVFPGSLE